MTAARPEESIRDVERLLHEGACAIFPGASACVMDSGRVAMSFAVGERPPGPVRSETRYDLASLTKPIATMTVVADRLASGALRLDDRLGEYLDCVVPDATLAHALGHATGLPAHRDLSRAGGPAEVRRAALSEAPVDAPGVRAVYSDLGYLLLGFWLEARFGTSLDVLADDTLSRLGLSGLHFRSVEGGGDDGYAPTDARSGHGPEATRDEADSLVERRGVVHDANAAALGGVAGHAGLFGDATSVAKWADRLLAELASRSPLGRALEVMWSTSAARADTTWRLGLDTASPVGSTAGTPPPGAVGHLGYTGTSVWMVPSRRWSVVLLSNRVYGRPDAETSVAMRRFRPHFHDAVWRALGQ